MSLGARYVCGFGSFDFRNYGDSAIEQRRCLAFENADIGVEARFEPPSFTLGSNRDNPCSLWDRACKKYSYPVH